MLLDAAALATVDAVEGQSESANAAKGARDAAPEASETPTQHPTHNGDREARAPEPGGDAQDTGVDGHVPRTQGPKAIVFVDAAVRDAEELTAALPAGVKVVQLSADRDGLQQISDTLARYSGVAEVHIVSHGDDGTVKLGNRQVTTADLLAEGAAVADWRDALTESADILLYGCDVGRAGAGAAFLSTLADLTDADVAASDDATGAAALGGDWQLETRLGAIEAQTLAAPGWTDLLAAPDPGGDTTVTDPGGGAVTVTEDAPAPGSANIRLTVPTLNDPDATDPTPNQIRILSVDGGTLALSDGAAIALGSAGTLLDLGGAGNDTIDLRFTPAADRDTDATFTYAVVDGGDDTLNSTGSTATIPVTGVQDAPTLVGNGQLDAVAEDAPAPAGTAVADLLTRVGAADVDDGASLGLAIVGADEAGGGTWQFSSDGGTSWTALGPRDANAALLLSGDAGNRLRFVPNADFNANAGTPTLTVRAWDRTTGQDVSTVAIGSTGGATAYSAGTATLSQSVTPVNDAPVLDAFQPTASLQEDPTTNGGVTVASLLQDSDGVSLVEEIDTGDTVGIALTDTDTAAIGGGTFEWRDGGTWTPVSLAAGEALLLAPTAELRFVPPSNASGTASFSYRAWDGSSGTAGSVVTPAGTGSTHAVSATENDGTFEVTPVNDAPSIDTSSGSTLETQTLTLSAGDLLTTDVDHTSVSQTVQLVYEVTSLPSDGELTFDVGSFDAPLAVGSVFTQADVAAGLIKYRYTGTNLTADTTDGFGFTVRDGAGGQAAGTFTVDLSDVNAAISISSTTITVDERVGPAATDTSPVNLTTQDADGDANLITYTIDSLPDAAVGHLEILDGASYRNVVIGDTITQAAVNAGGLRFVHTGDDARTGPAQTSFDVSVTDANPTLPPTTDTASIQVDVTPVNDPPAQAGDVAASLFTVQEGGEGTITSDLTPGVNYLDIDDADSVRARVTYTVQTAPTEGALFLDGTRIAEGATFTQADVDAGLLVYRHFGAEPDGTGAADDSFVYVMRDGDGGAVQDTFEIDVTPLDDPQATTIGRVALEIDPVTGAGGTVTAPVDTSVLSFTDADTPSTSVTFTITGGMPPNTVFQVFSSGAWSDATSFTQAQVDAGHVRVAHDGDDGDAGSYAVTFTVDDGTTTTADQILPVVLLTQTQVGTGTPGGVGDATPAITTADTPVVAEGSSGNAIGPAILDASDGDTAAASLTYTLDSVPANGTLRLNGTALSANDTFTQANVDAGELTYDHDGSETTADAFTVSLSDGDAGTPDASATIDLVVTPVNDVPAIDQTSTTLALSEGSTAAPTGSKDLTGVANAVVVTTANFQYVDADVGISQSIDQLVYVVTDTPDGGTLRVWDGAVWQAIADGGRFTAQQLADGHVAYFHDPNQEPSAGDELIVRLTDQATNPDGSESTSAPASLTFAVANVNDAPVTRDNTITLEEGETVMLTTGEIEARDSDDALVDLTYTLVSAPTAGTVELRDAGGTWNLLAATDTFTHQELLDGDLRYRHDGTETRADSFDYTAADDAPLTGNTSTVNVRAIPVNDAPTVTPAPLTPLEGEVAVLTAAELALSDPDSTALQVQVRLDTAVQHGRLLLDADGDVNTTGDRTRLGAGSSFTQADLDAGRVIYQHDNSENHTDGFDFTVADGGAAEVSDSFAIDVQAVNDAPTLTVGSDVALNEDDGATAIAGVSLGDIDAGQGTGTLRVTLAVADGTLALGTITGLTFVSGTSNGDATLEVEGSATHLNAALVTLTYTPDAGFNGADSLAITVNDTGQTGTDPSDPAVTNTPDTGGASDQTASDSVAITVRPLNDAPTMTYDGNAFAGDGAASETASEDTEIQLRTIVVSDIEIEGGETDGVNDGTFLVTIAAENGGNVRLASAAGLTQVGGTALTTGGTSISFTGTKAEIDTALAGGNLRYHGAGDFFGTEHVRVTLSDRGNEGAGGVLTATATIAVDVQQVNDTPTATTPQTATTAEDTPVTITLDASDVDTGTDATDDARITSFTILSLPDPATGELQRTNGTALSVGDVVTDGDQDGRVDVHFDPATDYNADNPGSCGHPASFTFKAADTAGAETPVVTVNVTVTPVNDDPTIDVTDSALSVDEGTPRGTVGTWVRLDAGAQMTGDQELVDEGLGFDGTTLRIQQAGGRVTTDRFDLNGDTNVVDVVGTDVRVDSNSDNAPDLVVGTVNTINGRLTVTFNADATQAYVSSVMGAVRYATVDDSVSAGASETVTLRFRFSDENGDGGPAQGAGGEGRATGDVTVEIDGANDAPTVADAGITIAEDPSPNTGTLVSDLGLLDSDPDSGASLAGIAVNDNAATAAQGTWQYLPVGLDASVVANWVDVDTSGLSDTNALILDANSRLRFVPADGDINSVESAFGTLTARGLDDTTTLTFSGATKSYADVAINGDATAISADTASVSVTVTAQNDAPAISGIDGTTVAYTEGSALGGGTFVQLFPAGAFGGDPDLDPGTAIASYAGTSLTVQRTSADTPTDRQADHDEFALSGSAVTVNATDYLVSLNGTDVEIDRGNTGSVDAVVATVTTNANGLLTLTFANAAGQDDVSAVIQSLTYRNTSDDPAASHSFEAVFADNNADTDSGINGSGDDQGAGGVLSDTAAFTVTISDRNDAPVASDSTLTAIPEDVAGVANTGDTVASLGLLARDPDGDTNLTGIAVFGTLPDAATVGEWQYDGGSGWQTLGGGATSIAETSAVVLSQSTALRFVPVGDYNGDPTPLSFRTLDATYAGGFSDASAVTTDATAHSGTSALSQNAGTLSVTVQARNDAPVLSGTPEDPTLTESTAPDTGTTPVQLVTGAGVSDLDLATTGALAAGTFGAGTITATVTGANPDDVLTVDVSTLTGGALPAGVIVSGGSGSPLTIDLAQDTTTAQVAELVEAIRYANTSDLPPASRTITIDVSDCDNQQAGGNAGGPSLTSGEITVTVDITEQNDLPTGTDATVGIAEDGSHTFQASDFRFASPGDESDTLDGVRIDTLPATGTLTLNGAAVSAGQVITQAEIAGGDLVYTPPAHANGTGLASFTFSVRDSRGTFDATPRTLTVDVDPRNDAPDLSGSSVFGGSISESPDPNAGTPAVQIVTTADLSDLDPATTAALTAGTFGAGTITVSMDAANAADQLSVATPAMAGIASVSGGTNGSDLVVSLSAGASVAEVEAILEALRYASSSDTLSGARDLTITLSDGNNAQAGGDAGGPGAESATLTTTITIDEQNDPPTGADATVSMAEDGSYTVQASDFGFASPGDESDTLDGVRIDTLPGTGTLTVNGAAVSAGQVITQAEIAGGDLVYTPPAHANGTGLASFTFSVRDSRGTFDATARTLTVDVDPRNDAPDLSGSSVFGGSISESPDPNAGTPAVQIVTTADLSDLDLATTAALTAGTFGAGTITVSMDAPNLADQLSVATPAMAGIASVGGGTNGADLVVDLTSGASVAEVEAILEALRYASSSDTLSGARAITITLSDGNNAQAGGNAGGPGAESATLATTITINEQNDLPTGQDATVGIAEDGSHTFQASDFGFASPGDESDTLASVVIETLPGAGTLTVDGAAVSAGDVITQAEIANGDLVYTPPADANGSGLASFTFSVRDSRGAFDATARTLTVDVTPVNDAPLAGGSVALADTSEDDPDPAGETVADLFQAAFDDTRDDSGTSSANGFAGAYIVDLTPDAAKGAWQISTDGGGTWSDVGARSDGTALFAAPSSLLRFLPATGFNGQAPVLGVRLADDSTAPPAAGTGVDVSGAGATGGITAISAGTVSLEASVDAINDPPAHTLPAAQTVAEEAPLAFSTAAGTAIAVGDPDAGGGAVETTLSVANGTLSLDAGSLAGSGASVVAGADGSASLTLSGTTAEITTALDGLAYRGDVDFVGADTLTIATDDQGNTGGPAESTTDTVAITVTPVNDAPTIAAPATLAGVEDTPLAIPGIQIADVDAGAGAIAVALSTGAGTLDVQTPGTAGLAGNGTGTVTLTGTLAEVNGALASLQLLPATHRASPDAVTDQLTITVDDQGNTGAPGPLSASRTVPLDIAPVADAPTLTATSPVTTAEDTPVALAITPALVDADGSESLAITISGIPAGASFANTAGDVLVPAGGQLTLTPAQLTGLSVTPPADSDADFVLSVTATATEARNGDAASTIVPVQVQVTPVPDAPTLTLNDPAGDEDTAIPLDLASFSDVDGSEVQTVRLSGLPAGASLSNSAGDALAISGGAITLTRAQLNGLALTPPEHSDADLTLGVTARSTEGGTTASRTGTLTVTVNAVADVPTLDAPANLPTVETGVGQPLSIDSALVDADGSETLSVTLSGLPADATLTNASGATLLPSAGTIVLAPGDLSGLTLTALTAGEVTLTATARTLEATNADTAEAAPQTIAFTVVDPATPSPSTPPGSGGTGGPGGGNPGVVGGGGATGGQVDVSGPDIGQQIGAVQQALSGFLAGGGPETDLGGLGGPDGQQIALLAVGSPSDQLALVESAQSFQLPENTFRHTDPDAQLEFEARRANGEALPGWIVFDAENQSFSTTPPPGAEGVYELRVIARDEAGNEAQVTFRLVVTQDIEQTVDDGVPGEEEAARPDLQELLRELLDEQAQAPGTPAPDLAETVRLVRAELGLEPWPWALGAGSLANAGGAADASAASGLDAGPAVGRTAFADQLRAAGRPGDLAKARQLLDSLGAPDPTGTPSDRAPGDATATAVRAESHAARSAPVPVA